MPQLQKRLKQEPAGQVASWLPRKSGTRRLGCLLSSTSFLLGADNGVTQTWLFPAGGEFHPLAHRGAGDKTSSSRFQKIQGDDEEDLITGSKTSMIMEIFPHNLGESRMAGVRQLD